MKACIYIKWYVDDKWQEQRFFNVQAQAAFMKENPEIAKHLLYVPRETKNETTGRNIKKD